MKRQEKYPETSTFHYINVNPKNRITGDCTFRAIALATGKSWKEVVMEMAEMSCKTGYAINDKKGIERYLKEQGWIKISQPRKSSGGKYTGKEFCKIFEGVCIANIGGHHITCIIDGKVNDIWDCTNKCIGNYWVKEE